MRLRPHQLLTVAIVLVGLVAGITTVMLLRLTETLERQSEGLSQQRMVIERQAASIEVLANDVKELVEAERAADERRGPLIDDAIRRIIEGIEDTREAVEKEPADAH